VVGDAAQLRQEIHNLLQNAQDALAETPAPSITIATAAVGGTTRASAAKALRNTSDLYALLVAYSDLGGCRQMVSSAAAPADVARTFGPACRHLERASALFARATQRSDPAALVLATHEIGLAQPALVRAMLAIRRGST
jgi:hypothetical protein